MTGEAADWPLTVRFVDVARRTPAEPLERRIVLDAAQRKEVAKALGLDRLNRLEAGVRLSAWHDGLRIEADWRADVTQTCGVSLDPFDSALEGEFAVDVVPAGSLHAPAASDVEIVLDLDVDDPPDVVEGDAVDVGAYVVEHLALEVDPFPRKPGAEFQPPEAEPEPSPFAVLRAIKPRED
jgi:hypothetical protein